MDPRIVIRCLPDQRMSWAGHPADLPALVRPGGTLGQGALNVHVPTPPD